jgi:hypothetical protein
LGNDMYDYMGTMYHIEGNGMPGVQWDVRAMIP